MKIAKVYAQTLYALAKEENQISAVYDNLCQYRDHVHGRLERFFFSPVFTVAIKVQLLKKVCQKIKIHPLIQRWLIVVAQKKRLSFLREMVQAYQQKMDEENNILRGQVLCAQSPSHHIQQNLKAKLTKVLHKSVVLDYKKDPQLMGGFKVQMENLIFDDSLLFHLKKIKEKLKLTCLMGNQLI